MFESKTRLQEDARGLLEALRELAEGRYAALFDAKGLVLESPEASGNEPLRRLVRSRGEALLALPAALHRPGEEVEDLFAEWERDEFFLASVNSRVGVLVACPDAKGLEADAGRLLEVLVDRLLRLNPAWRVDERGRGLFFGSPRLDTVVVGRPGG
jgi:hypothetical protein